MWNHCAWVIAIGLLLPAGALAQSDDDLVGELVLVKNSDVKIYLKKEVVNNATLGELLRVASVNGPWLWVPAKDGWLQLNDVVPVPQAIQYYDEQVQKNPIAQNFIQRGIAKSALNQYDAAIQDFIEAIKRDPKSASAYINRGNAWQQGGNMQQAVYDYGFAIQLDPKNPIAFNNRASAYTEMGDYKKAQADVQAALKLDSKFADAYNNLGVIAQRQGKLSEANKQFSKAIELYEFYAIAYANRATVKENQGKYQEAIKDFRKALELDPADENTHNNLAWLRATCPEEEIRDEQRAIFHAMKACELTGFQDWNMLDTLAASYALADQFKLALEYIDKALKLAPTEKKAELQQRKRLFKDKKPVTSKAKG